MALLESELTRIKYELGFPVLSVYAEPYVSIVAIFEQVIRPYLLSGATTTSSTAVVAAETPTPVTLTLADATGFSVGDRVIVDVEARQEAGVVRSAAGATIQLDLVGAHSGTYPVTVEGGESIIRELLGQIRACKQMMGESMGAGALKKVDEIEFHAAGATATQFGLLGKQLAWWRAELAQALGLGDMYAANRGGGSSVAVY